MASFTLTLELDASLEQRHLLAKKFRVNEFVYNSCLNELHKRFNRYKFCKKRKNILKYKYKDSAKRLARLKQEYCLSEYSMHTFVKDIQKHFKCHIDSTTAQKVATKVWKAFAKYMSGDSKKVYFKSKGDILGFEGKSNKSGIVYASGDVAIGTRSNKITIPVIIKKYDTYAQLAIQSKVKYCRILRKYIRGKERFFVQLILDGIPPLKNRGIGQGVVGIDNGTSSMAVTSENKVLLEELAPTLQNIDRKIFILNRKLDRSRRASNKDNYNADGTIKKGKKTWIKSKNYSKLILKRRDLYRKQAVLRDQSHNELANKILKLGDEFRIEKVSYKGLQKRAKKTEKSELTGKFKSKKRFGKSLSNRAPAKFIEILSRKLAYFNLKLKYINTSKVKASQFNHIDGTYTKKSLSARWNNIDGNKVQRDIYSSFLIKNTTNSLDKVNVELCNKTFKSFLKLHDEVINNIKNEKHLRNRKILKCFGI